MEPGLKIYQYRRLKGLSQAELAAKVGIAQANLSNIEKGKRDLTVSTLVIIAKALDVKPAMLLENETSLKPFLLSRTAIETLAQAILNPSLKVKDEIKEAANNFRKIIPQNNRRTSAKESQWSWMNLKQKFTSEEIKAICQRVNDARQRAHAQKTD